MEEIFVSSIHFEDDGYCTILAFADDPKDPQNYIMLQIINEPTPQDIKLGHDKVYFERSENFSGYDLVKTIKATDNDVTVCLNDALAMKSDLDNVLHISWAGAVIDKNTLFKFVEKLQTRL